MPAIILLFCLNLFAGTLVSSAPKFDLRWDNKTITYRDEVFYVQFHKRKCNEMMFAHFRKMMDAFPKGEYLRKGKGEINYVWNGKQYHEPLTSQRRKNFKLIPLELRRMKLESQLACQK